MDLAEGKGYNLLSWQFSSVHHRASFDIDKLCRLLAGYFPAQQMADSAGTVIPFSSNSKPMSWQKL